MLGIAKSFTLMMASRMDAVMALAVVGIVFMMILPLPTWLVDVLIAINISISSLLVVLALYLPGPLAFSTFPAFLLLTTLFRLGLSITTTRLILLQADAGEIVEAFGNFVVGGNLVVGVVIFLILLIVNFLVITKGSERVAEVSARFTLDAMPGKQMSIDSDLRGGLLDAKEAQAKRKSLSKESQLFGAMDGAMKFVKGDAIAGIIIVMVNIIGGYSIGTLQQGMEGADAIKLYAILTIGDGLVAQIPTLLIALSAGMIITRVKDDILDTTNVGNEMSEQLTSEPKAWLIASLVLIFFSIVPGMPSLAFWALSLFFASVGGLNMLFARKEAQEAESLKQEAKVESGTSDVANFEVYEPISLLVNSKYYGTKQAEELKTTVRKVRNNLVANYGFLLPGLTFQVQSDIEENNFQLRLYEVVEVNCTFDVRKVMVAVAEKERLDSIGVDSVQGLLERREDEFLFVDLASKALLDEHKISYKTSYESIGERCRDALKNEGYQFVGVDEAKKILVWVQSQSPELVKEFERLISIHSFSEILRNLVKESVSLRSLKKIVELIVKHGENERDTTVLTELVRMGLKEQVSGSIAMGKTLSVCLLEPTLEDYLRTKLRKTATGGFLELDEDEKLTFVSKISNSCSDYIKQKKPVALVVSQDIRPFVKNLMELDFNLLPVLSYTELSSRIEVEAFDRISLDV